MKNKLFVDGEVIGGHREQFAYIYSRLDKTPQNMTRAFSERGGNDGTYNPEHYLLYLDHSYGDPNAQARAVDRLRTMRQREDESFATFLPKFERELADAGGGEWGHMTCINYLEGALSHRLCDRLVNIPTVPQDYPGFVQVLQTISSRLVSLELSTRRSGQGTQRQQPISPPSGSQKLPTNAVDTMDWEPTRVNRMAQTDDHLRGKRAKWVDQAEMTKRRREGRCLRCGRSECQIANCPLLPARRPRAGNTNQTRVNKVYQAALEDEDEDRGSESDGSSIISGKE
jgi:hypothetical protein